MFFNLSVGILSDSVYNLFDTEISEFRFTLKSVTADNYSFVTTNLQKQTASFLCADKNESHY
jgi:hypothetical protein